MLLRFGELLLRAEGFVGLGEEEVGVSEMGGRGGGGRDGGMGKGGLTGIVVVGCGDGLRVRR